MKPRTKTKKILSAGLTLGILCSGATFIAPAQEAAAQLTPSRGAKIFLAGFENVYDKFLKAPFEKVLMESDAKNGYNGDLENIAYKAPTFNKGEFSISVFDYYKDQNFSKKIRVHQSGWYKDYTIKHGEQFTIKQSGAIIELDPKDGDPKDVGYDPSKGILITDDLLTRDKDRVGIALTNWQTFYLKQADQTSINFLFLLKFYPKVNFGNFSTDEKELYNQLDPVKKAMATVTTEPIDTNSFGQLAHRSLENFRLGDPDTYLHGDQVLIANTISQMKSARNVDGSSLGESRELFAK